MTSKSCPLCLPKDEAVLSQDQQTRVIEVLDPEWPGFRRVIWQDHVAEMTDLSADQQLEIFQKVLAQEEELRQQYQPDKINLASLGNMVPHLHWHVMCRWRTDPFWPGSVWSTPRATQSYAIAGQTVLVDQWSTLGEQARAVRYPVFVLGQAVTEDEEWDGLDPVSRHALILQSERPVATGRLLSLGAGVGRIGRMAVVENARGQGLGLAILQALIQEARALGFDQLILHAQLHALTFYERAGFVAEGPVFEECRIPHRQMRLTLRSPSWQSQADTPI
ncbi:MAG: GNAT family N-acetyltransferase [Betaproteobacteria bacterium]|nr:GNAT family N-acetyltransferase [Betaproteobacteria bacterium]